MQSRTEPCHQLYSSVQVSKSSVFIYCVLFVCFFCMDLSDPTIDREKNDKTKMF